jgi:hypothetical protein
MRHGAETPHEATARAVVSARERRTAMGGKLDQVKGRIKEALAEVDHPRPAG